MEGDALPTALEKARQDPRLNESQNPGRRQASLWQLRGTTGATTRIIAGEVGIDISTLHYHWGDKEDLYEAVIFDMAEDLRMILRKVEKVIKGRPLSERMDISIDMTADYLFDNPEISNLILLRYFSKTRQEMKWDASVPEFITDIARSMGLSQADGSVDIQVKMRILGMMNSIHNFISGEEFFCSTLGLTRKEYVPLAKQTLKFMMIPAFTGVMAGQME